MAGSNDLPTRTKIFLWIKAHEKTFYLPRAPIDPIGVYFSPDTRNFYAEDFIASYRGILILLMQKHLEFQIVTPRTLADFQGKTLVLPDVRVLGDSEKNSLQAFAGKGNRLVITGTDATGIGSSQNVVRFPTCPGRAYNAEMEKDFEHSSPDSQREFLESLLGANAVRITAGAQVATSIARTTDGHVNVFFANFAGLRGGSNPVQTPQTGVEVSVPSQGEGDGFFLPFLGEQQTIRGVRRGDRITYTLPAITKGGVFWYQPAEKALNH